MDGTMKAHVYYEPGVMKYETVAIPQVKDNQVLVKVRACGVCGSDVSYYEGHSPLETANGLGPLILGHEFSGEVVEIGSLARDLGLFQIGDRVLANPVQNCGACPQCQRQQVNLCKHTRTSGVNVNGAFAEYASVAYTHLHKLTDDISFEEAALCEPLACASYGVKKLDARMGDTVVIFGPGAIGLMMLKLLRRRVSGKIIMVGVVDYGLNKALEMGADHVFNTLDQTSPYHCADLVQAIDQLTDGELADRVIVPTAAKSALQGALEVSGRRANIVYFGLPGENAVLEVPLLKTLQMDKSINVSWLAPFTWDDALKALRDKVVTADEFITHRFPLKELGDAIALMNNADVQEKIKAMIII